MAKNDITIVLKQAVVLGVGDKAKTHTAGSTVKVADELAAQLIHAGAAAAATPAAPPTPAEPPSDSGDGTSGA